MGVVDSQAGIPVAGLEKVRQRGSQRCLLIEEIDPADADRMVSFIRQPGYNVRRVENVGALGRRATARKGCGKKPGVDTGREGGGKKPGKESVVGCVGKVTGRVPGFPLPSWYQLGKVGGAPGSHRIPSHVMS